MINAYRCLLKMRRQGYSRSYLQAWIEAVRWLRQNNRWLLDSPGPKQVTVTHIRRKT
jgi:hypothetical protein